MKESEKQSDNIRISPQYRVSNWVSAKNEVNWVKMVEIFNDRLEGRFLKAIRLIAADNQIGYFSGFAIMALDCLIIETLQQFYAGLPETEQGNGKVEKAFIDFLTKSESFNSDFNKSIAKTFYYHFRNGLLHQAQTKGRSLIKIGQETMVSKIKGGLIIDRKLFHDGIECEIQRYKNQLINNHNETMRINFIKKMDFICDLPQLPNSA